MEIDNGSPMEYTEGDIKFESYSAYGNVCDICAAEFIDDEELSHHILHSHQPESSLTRYCTLCRTLLPSIEDYANHILREHIWDLKTCEFCCRAFNDLDKLQSHIAKHRRAKDLGQFVCSCSQCPLLFSSIDDLITHEGKNHENHEGIMLWHCLPHLSSILHMKAQTFLRSLGEPNMYSCIKCKFTTIKPTIYLNHLELNHTRCIVCYECAAPFRNLRTLHLHFKMKSNKINTTKKCRYCKSYYEKDSVLSHEIICKDTFKCKLCDVITCSVEEMASHQVQEHPAVVTIVVCSYCGKNCPGQESYMIHKKRVHDPHLHLYKYTCTKCHLFYKHPKKLLGHYYTMHKNLEPYSCKLCEKKFRIRKNFTVHIKTVHKNYGFVRFDDNFHVYFCNTRRNTVLDDHDYGLQNENAKKAGIDKNPKNMDTNVESTKAIEERDSNNDISNFETDIEKVNSTENVNNKNMRICDVINEKVDDVAAHVNNILLDIRKNIANNEKEPSQSQVKDLIISSSDDDIPLNEIKKQQTNHNKALLKNKYNSKHFTCRECNKKCYTFNNYNNHLQTHTSKSMKHCNKCGMVFKKTSDLKLHKTSMHNRSELTQTLKKIIERRNQEKDSNSNQFEIHSVESDIHTNQPNFDDKSEIIDNSKFKLAVKKVNLNDLSFQATAKVRDISLYNTNNVKTFLESFKSDIDKKQCNESLKIRKTIGNKVPVIQMTQVNLEPSKEFTQLSMPVKYRECYKENHKAKLKVVLPETNVESKLNFGLNDQYPQISIADQYLNDVYNNDDDSNHEEPLSMSECKTKPDLEKDTDFVPTPDVGQEVFIEEPQMQKVREIILPECAAIGKDDVKEVSIGYLMNKAPFYKVVKVKTLLKKPKIPKQKKTAVDKNFKVPENIKLVNVNPLQHLLKGQNIEKMEEISQEHIEATENYKKLLAKALLELESQETAESKKKSKKNESAKEILIEE